MSNCPFRFVKRMHHPRVPPRYILQWWDGEQWVDVPTVRETA